MSAVAVKAEQVGIDPRTITCGQYKVFPESSYEKAGKFDFNGAELKRKLGLNALWYYTTDGRVKPTLHEKQRLADPQVKIGVGSHTSHDFYEDPVDEVAGILGVALFPWGERGIYMQHVGEPREQAPAYVDIPGHLQELNFHIVAGAVSEMMDDDEPVYVGLNNSAGGLEETDKGLMSILRPHLQVVKFGPHYVRQTPEDISRARNNLPDDRIRKSMGEAVVTQLAEHDLPNYWENFEIASDNMGATIKLNGFTPQDMTNPQFRKFLKTMFHTVHHQEELLHEEIYVSKHHEVVEYVQSHRDLPRVNKETVKKGFDALFDLKAESDTDSDRANELRRLEKAGLLRHPVGWALMMQFTKEGAFFIITPSITNESIGPVESLTYGFKRDGANLSEDKMQDILEYDRKVLINAIGGMYIDELPLAA